MGTQIRDSYRPTNLMEWCNKNNFYAVRWLERDTDFIIMSSRSVT